MSSFYLDILKDRMYTSKADSLSRRSAQTVLHEILDTLLRLLAPVLSFTADEAWQHMPARKEQSIHLAAFPLLHPEWKDDTLVGRWDRIMKVRSDVSKALELARVAKTIGHSLDAAVTINGPGDLETFLKEYSDDLSSIFIVSRVGFAAIQPDSGYYKSENIEGLEILVTAAPGDKCERCWCYSEELGTVEEHPAICPKCTAAVM
jgi:isoleucyl-tRNA synthetase